MAQNWFYSKGDQQKIGPISAVDLQSLAKSGELKPSNLVWKEGTENWVPASRIKGLFPAEAATSATPPPLPAQPSSVTLPPLPTQDPSQLVQPTTPQWKKKEFWSNLASRLFTMAMPSRRKRMTSTSLGCCLLLMCLILGAIGSVLNPKVKPETITADFYPFKNSKVQERLTTLFIDKGGELKNWWEYTQEGSDRIVGKHTSCFAITSNGMEKLSPNLKPREYRYLQSDGFVEIGETNEALKTIIWHPLLKIGAKVGDEWKREVQKGIIEEYKFRQLAEFDTPVLGEGPKKKVWSAFITKTIIGETGTDKPIMLAEETVYGIGLGPIMTRSWRYEGGKLVLNWNEVLLEKK